MDYDNLKGRLVFIRSKMQIGVIEGPVRMIDQHCVEAFHVRSMVNLFGSDIPSTVEVPLSDLLLISTEPIPKDG